MLLTTTIVQSYSLSFFNSPKSVFCLFPSLQFTIPPKSYWFYFFSLLHYTNFLINAQATAAAAVGGFVLGLSPSHSFYCSCSVLHWIWCVFAQTLLQNTQAALATTFLFSFCVYPAESKQKQARISVHSLC